MVYLQHRNQLIMKKLSILLLLSTLFLFNSCNKAEIRNDMKGEWNLTVMAYGGNNLVNGTTSYTLEFYDVKRKGGKIVIRATDAVDTYISTGSYTINKAHTQIEATIIDQAVELYWKVDLTVDENNLSLSGTSTDNQGGTEASLLVNGNH